MTRLEDRQTLIGQIAEARGNGARRLPPVLWRGLIRAPSNAGGRTMVVAIRGEDSLQGGDLVLPPLRMLFRGVLDG